MKKAFRRIDINCDLGEGEPLARTRALMRLVTSANVACGGHAGSVRSMQTCVEFARSTGAKLGAHPGFCDRTHFGRRILPINGQELELLLLQQVGALEKIASQRRVPLHHIKLHGGLYHAIERDRSLAKRYLAVVHRYWRGAIIYALKGGTVHLIGREHGVEVWGEGFADRAYEANGTLVPRSRPGAVLTTSEAVVRQVKAFVGMRIDTICIHADTANAVRLAKQVVAVAMGHKLRS